MQYSITETDESISDVINLAKYIKYHLENPKTAEDFVAVYDIASRELSIFPKGYRGIDLEYWNYEIRIKPFGTYNIFFVVDEKQHEIVILRVLKDLQNWNQILRVKNKYHFDM